MWAWYQHFEVTHFPDPMDLRGRMSTWTLGLYPNVIKWVFAVFDLPQELAVARAQICAAGVANATRARFFIYYGAVFAYYWVLSTPVCSLIFGHYLALSANWIDMHSDEASSALRSPRYKQFLRMHILPSGRVSRVAES